jgi:predicted transcriptional regulator
MSSLFADMRRKGIASYNTKTRKWFITDKGKGLLENAKREWGKRYAEMFWNHSIDYFSYIDYFVF